MLKKELIPPLCSVYIRPSMNRLIYILILFILLLCGPLSGSAGDDMAICPEVTASWERDASSRMEGEAALSAFYNGGSSRLILNSLCDVQSMREIDRIINTAASVLRRAACSGFAREESALARAVLSRAGKFSIIGLSETQSILLRQAEVLPLRPRPVSAGLCCSPFSPDDIISASGSASLINTRDDGPELKPHRRMISFRSAAKNVKPGPLRDLEFADKYRLFLYLRDDGPHVAELSYIELFTSLRNLFRNSMPLRQIHHTANQSSSETNLKNKFIIKGVPS